MSKELDGKIILSTDEIEEKFGWKYPTLYYFMQSGLLSQKIRFYGDKNGYWLEEELIRIKNRPSSETKRGNPGIKSAPRIFEDPAGALKIMSMAGSNDKPEKPKKKERTGS